MIFCGHFPGDVRTFSYEEEQLEGETRGQWYLRQIQGSANIEGGFLLHLLTGNLSHQIEHHAFSGLPGNRYAELAPRDHVCERAAVAPVRVDVGPRVRPSMSDGTDGRHVHFSAEF